MSRFILTGVFAFVAATIFFAFKMNAFTPERWLEQNMRACDTTDVPTRVAGCTELLAWKELPMQLRALAYLLSFIWFIALLVTTAQSPTKQGLHDRYAKTMVVKAVRRNRHATSKH